jgi:hypothetical protein
VLFKWRAFAESLPVFVSGVLRPVRALGTIGAVSLACSFPVLFVVAVIRRWSSLRFIAAAFGSLVLLLLFLVVVATMALAPFGSACSGVRA